MIGRLVIGAAALAVLAYAAALVFGGVHLPAPGEAGVNKDHVILLVVATLAASLLHVGASIVAHRAPPRLLFVLVVAIAARLILVLGAAPPVLEACSAHCRFGC